MPIKTWRGAMAASGDIASFTAEIPEFTDDCTDVGARVTHGAVTDDYMDVRLQGWRTTAGMQALEQRREQLPSSRNACSRYRENITLSKLRTCAAMMRSVAPHTQRRHEQTLKKFNALCGRCVLYGGKFRPGKATGPRHYAQFPPTRTNITEQLLEYPHWRQQALSTAWESRS